MKTKKKIKYAFYNRPYEVNILGKEHKGLLKFHEMFIIWKTNDNTTHIKKIIVDDLTNELKTICDMSITTTLQFASNDYGDNCLFYGRDCDALIILNQKIWQYFKIKENLTSTQPFLLENGDYIFEGSPTATDAETFLGNDDIKFSINFYQSVRKAIGNDAVRIISNVKNELKLSNFNNPYLLGLCKAVQLLDNSLRLIKINCKEDPKLLLPLLNYWIIMFYEVAHTPTGSNAGNCLSKTYSFFKNQQVFTKENPEINNLIDQIANYVWDNAKSFFYIIRNSMGNLHPASNFVEFLFYEEPNPILQSFLFHEEVKQDAIQYMENLTNSLKYLISYFYLIDWTIRFVENRKNVKTVDEVVNLFFR